ncbi:MAG TPA: ankyrin repeat domain-containing protein [Cyclobacteriaceae bacterium]|nr:ankyrin repeat domain-containing protein [Cyclobacteriaceae bacterium]
MTEIQKLIVTFDCDRLRSILKNNPHLANQGLPFDEKNHALAHPLHRICDAVFGKTISDEQGVIIARIFLEYGADVNGGTLIDNKDTPLTAAASLHAEKTGMLYIDHGANIHHPGCHGGTALHWAAWVGRDKLVDKLIGAGADIHRKCVDFKNTPLQWAVHGYTSGGKENKLNQVECIKLLLAAGAEETPEARNLIS